MLYQVASKDDVPAIVLLLKESLGEDLMPKTVQYWEWKHQLNPFGESPVLLCRDGDRLVGVRAFMRWQWRSAGGQILSAVRAVDTATHPDYQGKGIFKKLTLDLVAMCRDAGDAFVFNTPNSQSKPGYLKMGWVEAGQLPIRLRPRSPVSMLIKGITNRTLDGSTVKVQTDVISTLEHSGLQRLIAECQAGQQHIHTHLSVNYLRWRYHDVPVAEYWSVHHEEGGKLTAVIFGRVKTSRFGREFRITDALVSTRANGGAVKKQFQKLLRELDIDYVTFSALDSEDVRQLVGGWIVNVKGPTVTIRSLNDDLSELKTFSRWSPTLGDLELF